MGTYLVCQYGESIVSMAQRSMVDWFDPLINNRDSSTGDMNEVRLDKFAIFNKTMSSIASEENIIRRLKLNLTLLGENYQDQTNTIGNLKKTISELNETLVSLNRPFFTTERISTTDKIFDSRVTSEKESVGTTIASIEVPVTREPLTNKPFVETTQTSPSLNGSVEQKTVDNVTNSLITNTPITPITELPDINPDGRKRKELPDYRPIANAGEDIIIYLPQNWVNLDGSLSSDDHGIVSWNWQDLAMHTPWWKKYKAEGMSTAYPRLSHLELGTYTFRMGVTDTKGQYSEDTVNIYVKASSRPDYNPGYYENMDSSTESWNTVEPIKDPRIPDEQSEKIASDWSDYDYDNHKNAYEYDRMIQRPKMLEDHIDSHLIEKQEFPDEIMRIITGLCFACCMVLTAMCLFISFNRLNANKRKGQIIKFNKSQAKVEIHSDEDAMITEEQRKSPIIKVKKYQ